MAQLRGLTDNIADLSDDVKQIKGDIANVSDDVKKIKGDVDKINKRIPESIAKTVQTQLKGYIQIQSDLVKKASPKPSGLVSLTSADPSIHLDPPIYRDPSIHHDQVEEERQLWANKCIAHLNGIKSVSNPLRNIGIDGSNIKTDAEGFQTVNIAYLV